MSVQSAIRIADLINKIGINTHINYTDGKYANIAQDLSDLQYLGLTNLRDAAPSPTMAGQANLGAAAQAGMKFDFVVRAADKPADAVKQIHDFVAAHPNSVSGIEGPNEVNNFPVSYGGLTGTAAAQAYQRDLYAAVKADPLLKGIPVLGFTDYPLVGTTSDWGNIHLYDKDGGQPRTDVSFGQTALAATDPGKPFAITEIGYHTSIPAGDAIAWEGVDQGTQAKLTLNSLFDAVQLGSSATYLYELLDAYPDPQNVTIESHFGLFNLDNTPKPAATALHNLTTILGDGGTNALSFSPGSLDYSVNGLPNSAHSLLTQKSDRTYQIIVWNEPDIWNEQTNQPIAAASSAVSVQLGQVFASVRIYDPLQTSTPVQTLQNVSSIPLALSDRPVIIEVSGPVNAGTTPSTGGGTATTVGTGPDQLVLKVSQDAYKGNAQYTISVDGKQVGGTLTAQAAHTAGSSALDDTVTVKGSFGAGPHTVSVNFLNDLYEGPGKDRNLYVDAASYNGAAVANSSLTLLNGGIQQIAIPGTGTGLSPTPSPGGGTTATVGTGPDQFVLKISQDAYKGDAQYTVSVDGKQVGGTLTAQAAHTAGSSALDDTVTVQGSFGAGPHTVSVNFLNDLYEGPGNDRNLYVDAASYNGAAVANSSLTLLNGGAQQIAIPGTGTGTGSGAGNGTGSGSGTGSGTGSGPTPSPGGGTTATVGTGPDQLVLKVSQDAYKGNAQYTVSVDGKQVGGTLTAQAAHTAGSSALDDTVTVQGSFGAGPHTVSVNFLNDLYEGPGNDRNLYVDAASYNGAAVANSSLTLLNGGIQQIAIPGSGTGSGPTPSSGGGTTATVGTGPDQLVLKVSQDAYKGDAQYTVSVDGKQVGGTLTAQAAHTAGSSVLDDLLTVQGNFGAGPHTVSVNFLNDLYEGPGNDRNLYVDAASYNGTAVANSSLTLLNGGAQQFSVPGTATSAKAAATLAAPGVALTHDTGTGGLHITSDGLITFTPSVSGDTLHYKLDNGAFSTTTPFLATNGNADGQHTITVYETNGAGLTSANSSLLFTLDTHHTGSGG